MAKRRSREVRPGVTNRQSWYSTNGSASANPMNMTSLIFMVNGSVTLR
jgi:hypothetical protein